MFLVVDWFEVDTFWKLMPYCGQCLALHFLMLANAWEERRFDQGKY